MKETIISASAALGILLLAGCKTTEDAPPVKTWTENEVNNYASEVDASYGERMKFRGNRRLNYPGFTVVYQGSSRTKEAFPVPGAESNERVTERFLIAAGDTKQTVEWVFREEAPQPARFEVGGQTFSLMIDSHRNAPREEAVALTDDEAAAVATDAADAIPFSRLVFPDGIIPGVNSEGVTPQKLERVDEALVVRPVMSAPQAAQ